MCKITEKGKKYGNLTIIDVDDNGKYKCKCECGRIHHLDLQEVKKGHYHDCKCKRIERGDK